MRSRPWGPPSVAMLLILLGIVCWASVIVHRLTLGPRMSLSDLPRLFRTDPMARPFYRESRLLASLNPSHRRHSGVEDQDVTPAPSRVVDGDTSPIARPGPIASGRREHRAADRDALERRTEEHPSPRSEPPTQITTRRGQVSTSLGKASSGDASVPFCQFTKHDRSTRVRGYRGQRPT